MSSDENKKKTEPYLKLGVGLTDAFSTAKLNLGTTDYSKVFGQSPNLAEIGKLAKVFEPINTSAMAKLFPSYDTSSATEAIRQLTGSSLAMANASIPSYETHKREIEKLKKSNEALHDENANLEEEKQKLIADVSTYKEQITIYQAKDEQIETFITRLKDSGKLSEDELKELNASEDELDRLERARDLAIKDEKDTIGEAVFQITDSMKSLKASMVLYVSLLIGSSVIAILLICSLLWSVFFGAPVEVSKINGLMANYLALASPSVLKIVLLVIVLRFINNILKLRENLLVETGYIEKISGVLKAGMLMSDYSRSMIEARDIFKKVINQLIKKDSFLDKDKVKEEDDSMAMSIAEKTVSIMTKSIK